MLEYLSFAGGILLLILVISAIPTSVKIIGQYERAVLLRFGRFVRIMEPGLNFIIPYGIDRAICADLRIATIDVSGQDIIWDFTEPKRKNPGGGRKRCNNWSNFML